MAIGSAIAQTLIQVFDEHGRLLDSRGPRSPCASVRSSTSTAKAAKCYTQRRQTDDRTATDEHLDGGQGDHPG
jgi:hypothetical protein